MNLVAYRTRGDDSSADCVHLVRMCSWCRGGSFVGVCGGGRDGWWCRDGIRIRAGRARLLAYAFLRRAGDGGLIVVVIVRDHLSRCRSTLSFAAVVRSTSCCCSWSSSDVLRHSLLQANTTFVVGSMVMTVGKAGVDNPSWLCVSVATVACSGRATST